MTGKINPSVIPVIESVYDSLTDTEKIIAEYFIQNRQVNQDFSARNISKLLGVSEASLTRFAKKCGHSGYRDFIFDYEKSIGQTDHVTSSDNIKRVLFDYQSIVDKYYSLIDDNQIQALVDLIYDKKRVYFYGKGSSGIAAMEAKLRFMRLGIYCEAVTDNDMMAVNHVLVDEDTLVIGLSISGSRDDILNGLKAAKANNAHTVLVTAQVNPQLQHFVDEVITVASVANLDYGNRISPQIPLLIFLDIVYDYFMEANYQEKQQIFENTLDAIGRDKKIERGN